jgi:ABC-type transporter Mla MlaB component
MLRLTVKSCTSDIVLLQVDGRLQGVDVEMLAREGAAWLRRGCRLALDVAGVHEVDARGVELLESWSRQGVEIRDPSMYLRALLGMDHP